VFLAAYTVVFLWLRNTEETRGGEAAIIVFCVAALTAGLLVATKKLLGDEDRAAALVGCGVVLFLGYGHVYSLVSGGAGLRHRYLLAAVVIVLASVIWLSFRTRAFGPGFSRAASLSTGLLLLLAGVSALGRVGGSPRSTPEVAAELLHGAHQASLRASQPDVYCLYLDGYARADVLAGVFSFDNAPFIERLQARGFSIMPDAFANYPTTLASLASALNLSYLQGDEGLLGQVEDFGQLLGAIHGNRVLRLFDAAGYETTVVSADRYAVSGKMMSDRLETGGTMRLFWSAWLRTTILRASPGLLRGLTLGRERRLIQRQFELLGGLVERQGPKLVIFHVISPHPPYLFRADGSSQLSAETSLTDWLPREAYVEQLQYINSRVVEWVDRVASAGQPPSVILLLSDHGPASGVQQGWAPRKEFVLERTPILLAARSSLQLGTLGLVARSPISAMRWLVREALEVETGEAEDRAYFSETPRPPYEFVDVTSLIAGATAGS
jgi:hypothetical protein